MNQTFNGLGLDLDAWREFHEWDTHSARAAVTVVREPTVQSCVLTVDGALPTCSRLPEADEDYYGRPRPEGAFWPGPFAKRQQTANWGAA